MYACFFLSYLYHVFVTLDRWFNNTDFVGYCRLNHVLLLLILTPASYKVFLISLSMTVYFLFFG